MKLNPWMTAAAALLFLTTGVHVFMGGPEIHHVIQASALPEDVRAIGAVLWHAITATLLVFALGCLWLAHNTNTALAVTIGAVQVLFAVLFIFYGATLLGTLWVMPQWIIFLLIPVVMLLGLLRQRR
ncbi:hypothetical protein [Shimia sp.]|uniref:hypothetical protein n=1 Tax=Shimia sp. TaxID=1954381 RepID=UPI003B8D1E9F